MMPYTWAEAELDLTQALERHDLEGAFRTCRAMDRMDPPSSLVTITGAALWYAERGMPVFPVQPLAKTPYPGSRGLNDATTDPVHIMEMFTARPGSNLAIATGHVYDVIDIDGQVGNVTLARHLLDPCDCNAWSSCARHHPLYSNLADPWSGIRDVFGVVSTPRAGGRHLYVPARGRRNRAGMEGLDYRGLGGYVLVPPSVTEAGFYTWTKAIPS